MTRPDPVTRARQRLRQAIDRVVTARGEAEWKNGYRHGARGRLWPDEEYKYRQQERKWVAEYTKAKA